MFIILWYAVSITSSSVVGVQRLIVFVAVDEVQENF